MSRATQAFHNRIVLVFDFDRTLGDDSANAVIKYLGGDPDEVRSRYVEPLESSWDDNLARLYGILHFAGDQDKTLTQSDLEQIGRDLPLYDGVETMPDRLRKIARQIVDDVEVEFRILSGGFTDVINATPIASQYEAIYGFQVQYDDEHRLTFPRRVITHPEKVRYLMAISKGLSKETGASPANVFQHVDDEQIHVPFDQMIYLGDGASDLPAFDLIQDRGGIALGILEPGHSPDQWKHLDEIRATQRVQNLAQADYREGSELFDSLTYAVTSIANLVALRRLSRDK